MTPAWWGVLIGLAVVGLRYALLVAVTPALPPAWKVIEAVAPGTQTYMRAALGGAGFPRGVCGAKCLTMPDVTCVREREAFAGPGLRHFGAHRDEQGREWWETPDEPAR